MSLRTHLTIERKPDGSLETEFKAPLVELLYAWVGRYQRENATPVEFEDIALAFMTVVFREHNVLEHGSNEEVYAAMKKHVPKAMAVLRNEEP